MEGAPGQRVITEEMHPDPPGRVHRGICAGMIVLGVVLIVVGAVFGGLWGPLRILFALVGAVLVIVGFLLAVDVRKLKIKASRTGGIEASAEMGPKGYTKTLTISDSLVEGSIPSKTGTPPPKEGVMPPKAGVMPAKTVEQSLRRPTGPDSGGSSQGRPQSSAKP